MNSVHVIGRLAADVELRHTPSGKAVAEFRIAVQRPRRGGEDRGAVFLTVQAWEGRAEVAAEHLAKGDRVGVTGRLEQDEWKTEDGNRREKLYLVAENLDFLEPPTARDAAAEEPTE
jgi:single-strand DNA-binding protein